MFWSASYPRIFYSTSVIPLKMPPKPRKLVEQEGRMLLARSTIKGPQTQMTVSPLMWVAFRLWKVHMVARFKHGCGRAITMWTNLTSWRLIPGSKKALVCIIWRMYLEPLDQFRSTERGTWALYYSTSPTPYATREPSRSTNSDIKASDNLNPCDCNLIGINGINTLVAIAIGCYIRMLFIHKKVYYG